ncbi:MAG: arylsulfatase, partial [Gemmataceae bacterium]
EGDKPVRDYLLQQTMSGKHLSIRSGKWKYQDHQSSGGNNYERDGEWGMKKYALPEKDPAAPGQLYDLESDPGETTNLYSKHPDVVKRLKAKLDEFVRTGRSGPHRE